MKTNLLSNIPFFSILPVDTLDQLQNAFQVKYLKENQILFREGEPGEHFYIVIKGEIQVFLGKNDAEEMRLNTLRSGEYLGEMALITPGGARTASARANQDSVLLSLSRSEFANLLEKHPKLAHGMILVLSQRLDATNDASFRDLKEKNRQLLKAYNELKEAHEQLLEKERLERELQVAADIQLSILPTTLPTPPTCNFGARILAARQVGGDFYDVFRIDENKVAVLIGDVTDKGVPAAIFMARAHALIVAESRSSSDPEKVLQRVNAHITKLEKSSQFVTVIFGILNVHTHEFTYARAGHEPALLLKPGGTVERIPHNPGMAIGLWNEITIDINTLTLAPDTTLFLYTDGMTDCRNPAGESLGLENTKKALAETVGQPAQRVCDHMLSTLQAYQANAPQDDDITLVAIHIHALS
ncbi:MAG: hypothetical protein Kow002_18700 [Anaerolineales bacterium]